jgi:hypothetical protein
VFWLHEGVKIIFKVSSHLEKNSFYKLHLFILNDQTKVEFHLGRKKEKEKKKSQDGCPNFLKNKKF